MNDVTLHCIMFHYLSENEMILGTCTAAIGSFITDELVISVPEWKNRFCVATVYILVPTREITTMVQMFIKASDSKVDQNSQKRNLIELMLNRIVLTDCKKILSFREFKNVQYSVHGSHERLVYNRFTWILDLGLRGSTNVTHIDER